MRTETNQKLLQPPKPTPAMMTDDKAGTTKLIVQLAGSSTGQGASLPSRSLRWVFSMHYGNEIKNAFLPIFFSYLIPPFLPWSVHSKVNVQWTVPRSLLFSSYWSRLANRKPQHKMSRRKEMYGKAHAFFPLHLWGDCSASLIALQSVQVSHSQLLAPSSLCPAGLKDIRTSHTNLKGGMDFLSFACFLFLAESQDVGENFSMMPDL